MNWSTIGEIVKALGAVATAGAAWFAASIAYRGLERWRSEALGKRRAEVAAAALTVMYQAEDILREARAPWVLPHEMVKREGVPEQFAEDANFAPEARLLKHSDFFAKLRLQKHEFAAVFGKEAAKPFDEIWRARLDINHAAFSSSRATEDKLASKIAAQVEALEACCRPAIDARESQGQ